MIQTSRKRRGDQEQREGKNATNQREIELVPVSTVLQTSLKTSASFRPETAPSKLQLVTQFDGKDGFNN